MVLHTLDNLQDKQMLNDFVETKRGGICGIMGDRYINKRSIWYIDANNLYGYAMMQKLPYSGFEYYSTSLDEILNSTDDSDHGYYIVCDFTYTNICRDRTEQLALMPNKRKINDNESGYREKETIKARKEKSVLDQNNKTEYKVH